MNNVLSLTDFIRAIKEGKAGDPYVYFVPEGKAYKTTQNSLTATATREGISISTTQILIVEAGELTQYAVKVFKK
jgi:hypothetical protein